MIKLMTAALACALFLGAAPALADEAAGDPAEVPTTSSLVVLVAGVLGIEPAELERLREEGLGFGEIFKLKSLSQMLGFGNIDEFLLTVEVDPETGEYDFDWESLRETLSETQLAMLAELPKNFGEIVSAARRHHGRDAHQPDGVGNPHDDPSDDPDDESEEASEDEGEDEDEDEPKPPRKHRSGKGDRSGRGR